jgi:putative membrane-bound dehydrogenase-like protein
MFATALGHAISAHGEEPVIVVPPGFEVQHFADDDMAHDIHSLTIDAKGRVVVSGPGYIRILIDSDNDGKADTYKAFADAPKNGSQGMYFMGPHLLCTGDTGLEIFRDDNEDDQADGAADTFLKIAAGAEHSVHSIQKRPDGWWYIITGNNAGVDGAYATLPTSPLRNPQAGALMRLKADLSGGEVVSDGLRNPYDFVFSEFGDVFTADADGERDVSLPWYLPCRMLQLTPRSHAGWVSRNWKRPNDFPDMTPVLADFGRGSPTGMVCYRHEQFPRRYNGTIFSLDWTFGRILVTSLTDEGGSWKAASAVFAKANGQFGFAPTDVAVGPDGSMYVSVGGRGTRGSVYRIVHTVGAKKLAETPETGESAEQQLAYILNVPAGSEDRKGRFCIRSHRRGTSRCRACACYRGAHRCVRWIGRSHCSRFVCCHFNTGQGESCMVDWPQSPRFAIRFRIDDVTERPRTSRRPLCPRSVINRDG